MSGVYIILLINFSRPGVSTESGRAMRELSSIMMTTGGFLSSAREAKGPDARWPTLWSSADEFNTPLKVSWLHLG